MAKPKAKTMIERMGFKDKDIKTSKHDEIMFWLDNYIKTEFLKKIKELKSFTDLIRKNLEKLELYESLLNNDCFLEIKEQVDVYYGERYVGPSKAHMNSLRELNPFNSKIVWEKPIKKGRFNIGFIDLLLTIYPNILVNSKVYYRDSYDNLKSLSGKNTKFYHKKHLESKDTIEFYFEVKSEWPTLGELFRQMNFYRSNLLSDTEKHFFIVAPKPPKNHENILEILKEQGIKFIEYPVKTIKIKKGLDGFTKTKQK